MMEPRMHGAEAAVPDALQARQRLGVPMRARSTPATPTDTAPWMLWTGRVLTALSILAMLSGIGMKLSHASPVLAMWTPKFGYPESLLTTIGVVELLCVVLYAIPRTSVLGAILITGYLGGAVATHVRVSDVFVWPLMLGIFVWAGLFLRDPRVRALITLRS
jgi:hypothetical protein